MIPMLLLALILTAKFLPRKTPLKTAAMMSMTVWTVAFGIVQKIVGMM